MSELPNQFEKHIQVTDKDSIAVDFLALESGLSKQLIKKLMRKRGCLADNRQKNPAFTSS